MDIQTGVLLAVWLAAILLFSRKGRTSKKGQTEEQNHTQVETNQKNDTEPFDYGHFRDKLRRSWGLDQVSSEMNKELSQEESEQVVPKKTDAVPGDRPLSGFSGKIGKSREQIYAENRQQRIKTETRENRRPFTKAENLKTVRTAVSAGEFRKWIIYDAVFGAPRGAAPMKMPSQRGKRG